MSKVNVRVEAKKLWSNATQHDKDMNFKYLLNEFKRQVRYAGVIGELAERQYYESESRRRRRKRNEAKKENPSGRQRG